MGRCFTWDRRMQRPPHRRLGRGPRAHFIAFDLLYVNGRSVMDKPLRERKDLLSETLEPSDLAQPCDFIDADGKAFFDATCEHGLEGIMAKEKLSQYFPGKRSPGWHKGKRVRECEFVIGGYDFGGKRKELFSSLLLGLYDSSQRLVFVGHVGTGFSDAEAKRLLSVLQRLHTAGSPFENAEGLHKFVYWCRPELVCRVEYGEFTPDGRLRYPIYLSLGDDKPPIDCRIVDAPGWPTGLPVG